MSLLPPLVRSSIRTIAAAFGGGALVGSLFQIPSQAVLSLLDSLGERLSAAYRVINYEAKEAAAAEERRQEALTRGAEAGSVLNPVARSQRATLNNPRSVLAAVRRRGVSSWTRPERTAFARALAWARGSQDARK